MAVVCATMEGLYASCRFHTPNTIVFMHGTGESAVLFEMLLDRDGLKQEAEKGTFFSYVAGVS